MANGTLNIAIANGFYADNLLLWAEWSAVKNDLLNSSEFTISVYIQRKAGKLLPTVAKVRGFLGTPDNPYAFFHKSEDDAITIDIKANEKTQVCTSTCVFKHDTEGNYTLKVFRPSLVFFYAGTTYLATSAYASDFFLTFDTCDVNKPEITNLVVTPSQTSANIKFDTDCDIDLAQYSLNGGQTWINLPQNNNIQGLSDYTLYNIRLRVRKKLNQKFSVDISENFRTLPFKISSFDFPEEVDVDEGGVLPLSLNIQPSNASEPFVEIISRDKTIATADATQFYGHKKGSCYIDARTNYPNDYMIRQCQVNVIRRVKSVSVLNPQVTVNQSASSQIQWALHPQGANNTAVTFASSDSNVASVSSTGLISGISAGDCIITVASLDGGHVANIAVTVVDGITSWQNITTAGKRLNYANFVRIYENQIYLREKLINEGEILDILTPINDPTAINASLSTQYVNMRSVFEAIENNMNVLNSGSYVSPHYIGPHKIGPYEPNRAEYDRLVNILIDIKNHIERNQLITNGADIELDFEI